MHAKSRNRQAFLRAPCQPAAAIATGAIDADAVAEIQSELATAANQADLHTDLAAVKSDTGEILTDTGTTLQADLNAIEAKTDNLPSSPAASGAIPSAAAIADADVGVTTDVAGATVIASGKTDQNGQVVFYLDAGTVYVWRQKTGYNFANPDTEVVV